MENTIEITASHVSKFIKLRYEKAFEESDFRFGHDFNSTFPYSIKDRVPFEIRDTLYCALNLLFSGYKSTKSGELDFQLMKLTRWLDEEPLNHVPYYGDKFLHHIVWIIKRQFGIIDKLTNPQQ